MVHSTNRGKVSFWGGILTMVVTLGATFTLFTGHAAAEPKNNPGQPFEQLETKLDSMEGKIDALPGTTAVDALESKIDALPDNTAAIDALEGKVDALEGKVDSIEGKIDSIEGKIDALPDNTAAIDALEGKLDAVESKLDVIEAKLDQEPTARTSSTIFVTSQAFPPTGGLATADDACNAAADGAGLDGFFVAWASTEFQDARDRLVTTNLPYKRTDGGVVANDLSDLTDRSLMLPIDRDEFGAGPWNYEVWTGTAPDGTFDGDNCDNWTDNDDILFAVLGAASKVNQFWTDNKIDECDREAHWYCIQQ